MSIPSSAAVDAYFIIIIIIIIIVIIIIIIIYLFLVGALGLTFHKPVETVAICRVILWPL